MSNKIRVIAMYLPQYHPFKENDQWWGKGFTEWTNVGKAKPLFRGHYQPRVPADLGYYDLRLPIIREEQAELAHEAGIEGFMYWHYWFGNGKRLIPEVFDEVLASGSPSLPFCLGWANHSWFSKNWNADGSISKKLLMEQTYPGIEDEKMHFAFLIKAFKDKRYIKVDDKPLLYIFDPVSLPQEYVQNLKKWTLEAGFPGLYLVANITSLKYDKSKFLNHGYDAVSYQRIGSSLHGGNKVNDKILRRFQIYKKHLIGFLRHRPPFMEDYRKVFRSMITEEDKLENVIPTIVPQWDHTPRSGWNGSLLINSNPDSFYEHCCDGINAVKNKKNPILFLKSWNEWGEGNYMEPDLKFGKGYINALRKALNRQ